MRWLIVEKVRGSTSKRALVSRGPRQILQSATRGAPVKSAGSRSGKGPLRGDSVKYRAETGIFKAQTTKIECETSLKVGPFGMSVKFASPGLGPLVPGRWPVKMTRTQVAVKMTGTPRGRYYVLLPLPPYVRRPKTVDHVCFSGQSPAWTSLDG